MSCMSANQQDVGDVEPDILPYSTINKIQYKEGTKKIHKKMLSACRISELCTAELIFIMGVRRLPRCVYLIRSILI